MSLSQHRHRRPRRRGQEHRWPGPPPQKLGYLYVDTGAIYRTVALAYRTGWGLIPPDPAAGGACPSWPAASAWTTAQTGSSTCSWGTRTCPGPSGRTEISGLASEVSAMPAGAGLPAGLPAKAGPGAQRDHGWPGHRHRGAARRRREGVPHRRRRRPGPCAA